jgi:excisionase family DNA binding protein
MPQNSIEPTQSLAHVPMPTYTLSELATLLRVRRGVVTEWMNQHNNPLPYYRIHKKSFRFDLAEVRAWMNDNLRNQNHNVPASTGKAAVVIPLNRKH